MRILSALAIAGAMLVATQPAAGQITKAPAATTKRAIKVETVAKGLVHPWGLAFLPDGRLLVTERPGRMRIVGKDGKLSEPLQGVPAVYANGQGGLLDVVLEPRLCDLRPGLFLVRRSRAVAAAATAPRSARGQAGRAGRGRPARQFPGDLPAGAVLCLERAFRLAHRVHAGRVAVHHHGRPLLGPRSGAEPRPTTWASWCASCRMDARTPTIPNATAGGRRSGRSATATCRARRCNPASGRAVDHRARRARRRRDQRAAIGQELRLADHHLRPRLLRRQDRRGHREARFGAADLLLGPVDRPVGGGVLHRRPVPRMEGQPVRRRAGRPGPAPAGARRREGDRRGGPAQGPATSASATCARGPTAPSGF